MAKKRRKEVHQASWIKSGLANLVDCFALIRGVLQFRILPPPKPDLIISHCQTSFIYDIMCLAKDKVSMDRRHFVNPIRLWNPYVVRGRFICSLSLKINIPWKDIDACSIIFQNILIVPRNKLDTFLNSYHATIIAGHRSSHGSPFFLFLFFLNRVMVVLSGL